MNTKPEAPAPERYKKPIVGAAVHFFDDTRAQNPVNGAGPYAAIVVAFAPAGIALKIFAPYGVLDAERVPHKSELDPKIQGRKKWWNWPHETEKR